MTSLSTTDRFFVNLGANYTSRLRSAEALSSLGFSRFPALDAMQLKGVSSYGQDGYARILPHRVLIGHAKRWKADSITVLDDLLEYGTIEDIELPADCMLFLFGCFHHRRPGVVGSRLLKTTEVSSIAGYTMSRECYDLALKYIREPKTFVGPDLSFNGKTVPVVSRKSLSMGNVLSKLAKIVPTYAALPNMAWHPGSLLFDDYGFQTGGCLAGLVSPEVLKVAIMAADRADKTPGPQW
jgi:hypothetical protein